MSVYSAANIKNSLGDTQFSLVVCISAVAVQVDVVASGASEDEGKDSKATEKENLVASTDSKPPSDSTHKRQLSVREKAAAFLENTAKDSVC